LCQLIDAIFGKEKHSDMEHPKGAIVAFKKAINRGLTHE
jgi:hypothetical protein